MVSARVSRGNTDQPPGPMYPPAVAEVRRRFECPRCGTAFMVVFDATDELGELIELSCPKMWAAVVPFGPSYRSSTRFSTSGPCARDDPESEANGLGVPLRKGLRVPLDHHPGTSSISTAAAPPWNFDCPARP